MLISIRYQMNSSDFRVIDDKNTFFQKCGKQET